MNIFNKILLKSFSKTLNKNLEFKNLHSGESCYIFGNGTSLKYYDLRAFNDKPSIGCGAFSAHKDIKDLDLKYYYIGHPLFFYKFWKNPYSKNYEVNKVGRFYRRKVDLLPETQFFMSLSNYFGIRRDNVNFLYHFGEVHSLSVDNRADGIFSMMEGSLMGMIGVARYLGFSDITLVGCDYTFNPKMYGHFYEKGIGRTGHGAAFLPETFDLLKDKVTLRTVTPHADFSSDVVPSLTYQELSGEAPDFKENSEIIAEVDLNELAEMNMLYNIY